MSKYMITDGCLYLRRDASGNFVPVKSQPLGDVWISIHALREESDKTAYVANLSSRIISIHALREESDYFSILGGGEYPIISIHALREESDHLLSLKSPEESLFQSTLSVRRATVWL